VLLYKSKMTTGILVTLIGLGLPTHLLANDTFGQAFSGLNHFIPVHARIPLYKLKAQKNRIRKKAEDLRNKNPYGTGDDSTSHLFASSTPGDVFSSCSINIGNITPGRGASSFGSKETVVLIEGDVVNVADCSE